MSKSKITVHDVKVVTVPIAWLKPAPRNTRKHSKAQVDQLIKSFSEFGVVSPIVVDEDNNILAGHARLEAARLSSLTSLPVVRVAGLTDIQKQAYRIADNRIAELAEWDFSALADELKTLSDPSLGIDITATGFETGAIDALIIGQAPAKDAAGGMDEADQQPAPDPDRPIVSKHGDLWKLGQHRLLCGDVLDIANLEHVLDGKPADMVFTDPPFNLMITGFVCGLGSVSHDEFAMASGEMSTKEFQTFLLQTTTNLANATRDGSIHFICMDWRHINDLLNAGGEVYSELKGICVWNKSNGGMGSLYRSKHELVAVFKNGTAAHINNVCLGKHGRNRTNVWDYAGANSFGQERDDLAIHPTVKPVKMIEDAILDCSNRGDAILDAFCGSGSTLIAAERAGRRGFGLEIEPKYIDASLRRFRALTGEEPVRVADGAKLKDLE